MFRAIGNLLFSSISPTMGLLLVLPCVSAGQTSLGEPKQFSISLPVLSVFFDDETRNFDEVFISYGSQTEGYAVSGTDDRFVKITTRLREDKTFREPPRFEHLISPFEARHLNRICNTFVDVIEDFEKDLQKRNWDRVLYLDNKLSCFLKGFFYLVKAARNEPVTLLSAPWAPDSVCDRSPGNNDSRQRVQKWADDAERTTKLRIAARELVYQTKFWQKEELLAKERDPFARYKNRFEPAYLLFVKLYFNQP